MLSGVNRSQDVAEDVAYSGTIAGAMEGAMLGVPSIALSQAYAGVFGRPAMSGTPPRSTPPPSSASSSPPASLPGGLVNVNFPACPAGEVEGVAFTRQGRRNAELMRVEERRDGRGFPYSGSCSSAATSTSTTAPTSPRSPSSKISVTPLCSTLPTTNPG